MAKGWHVTFTDGDGKTQFFKVGISNMNAAIDAVVMGRNATEVHVLAFKEGEFEALKLEEGQVIQSAGIN